MVFPSHSTVGLRGRRRCCQLRCAVDLEEIFYHQRPRAGCTGNRSLIAAHLADINSSDEHTVNAWFIGKLDHSPPVVDLAEAGFLLIGGRMDMLGQRPGPAGLVQHRNHWIYLIGWPVGGLTLGLTF